MSFLFISVILFLPLSVSSEPAEVLTISSAGRFVSIGALYDGTKNSFTGDQLLLTNGSQQVSLQKSDITLTDTRFQVVDSLEDKVSLLGLEPALVVDIVCGNLHPSGVFSSLRTHFFEGPQREGWLFHEMHTIQESANFLTDENRGLISSEILRKTSATHMVTGIHYGVNILFKFVAPHFRKRSKGEIKTELEREINANATEEPNYLVEMYSDLRMLKTPINLHDSLQVLTEDFRQGLSRVNSGRGKPLKYVLTPITTLKSHGKFQYFNIIGAQRIPDLIFLQCIRTFDELLKVYHAIENLQERIDLYETCIHPTDIKTFNNLRINFKSHFLNMRLNLTSSLTSLKSSDESPDSLLQIVSELKAKFNLEQVQKSLETLTESIETKIDVFQNFVRSRVFYVGKHRIFESIRWQTIEHTLYVLIYDSNLMKKDRRSWEVNTQLLLGPLNSNSSRLAVVDGDIHPEMSRGLNRTIIREYRHGMLSLGDVSAAYEPNRTRRNCDIEAESLILFRKLYNDLRESSATTIHMMNETISNLMGHNARNDRLVMVASDQIEEVLADSSQPELRNISESLLSTLLNKPRARLFSRENFTGKHEDYSSSSPSNKGSCFNLMYLQEQVQSVDTYGTCIRLFQLMDCAGHSLAIYPGSDNATLSPELEGVHSVGPCLSNEFEGAKSLEISGTNPSGELIQKSEPSPDIPAIPDLLLFGGIQNAEDSFQQLWHKENPITNFRQGPQGRLENLRAFINNVHLRAEVQLEDLGLSKQTREAFNELERKAEDIPGYAIPLKYGGPDDELYNIFPQSNVSERRWKAEVDDVLRNQINDYALGSATIYINFLYSKPNSSRPYAFTYHISVNGYNDLVKYGLIRN